VPFDKIASVYFIWKIYRPIYFSVGNGQPRQPALCQLYRHTFVPYQLQYTTDSRTDEVACRSCDEVRAWSCCWTEACVGQKGRNVRWPQQRHKIDGTDRHTPDRCCTFSAMDAVSVVIIWNRLCSMLRRPNVKKWPRASGKQLTIRHRLTVSGPCRWVRFILFYLFKHQRQRA